MISRIERFLNTADGYVRSLREGMALADASQRHEDNMAVWIIGLATGALIAIPSLLSQVVPQWGIGVSIVPFIFAIILGIVYRLLLAELMTHDDYFGFLKIHKVEALKLSEFDDEKGVDEALKELLNILNDKGGELGKRKQTVDNLNWWIRWMRFLPYGLFGLGVVVTAIIAVFYSKGGALGCW